jgi:hypothetical protein
VHATVLRQLAYGACAVVGLVGTWYFNLTYTGAAPYLSAWFANAASSSAAVDLLVAFLAGAIFMIAEGRRLGMRWSWVLVVLSVVLAFAFAFPLFLLLRERVLAHRTPATGTAAAVAP